MARTGIKVDMFLLQNSIDKVESKGKLSNLSELWRLVAEEYNRSKNGMFSAISPAVAGLRAKEKGLRFQTTAGKIGRAAGSAAGVAKAGITILTEIGDPIERTAERGKYIGNVTKLQPVIAFDKYNWILTYTHEDGEFDTERRFYPNFKLLLSKAIPEYLKIDCKIAAQKFVDALNKLLETNHNIAISDNMETTGYLIDSTFDVNYLHGSEKKIYERLTKNEVAEEVEETE